MLRSLAARKNVMATTSASDCASTTFGQMWLLFLGFECGSANSTINSILFRTLLASRGEHHTLYLRVRLWNPVLAVPCIVSCKFGASCIGKLPHVLRFFQPHGCPVWQACRSCSLMLSLLELKFASTKGSITQNLFVWRKTRAVSCLLLLCYWGDIMAMFHST